MLDISKKFENRKFKFDKLLNYGFVKDNNSYIYEKNILENHFTIIIVINKFVKCKVIDNDFNEEYLPFYVKDSSGEFIGLINEEFDLVITDILENCTYIDIFKNENSKKIIKYIEDNYHDKLEFLWDKFPSFAVVRNGSNNKWYCLLAKIKLSNLELDSDDLVEVINLRYNKDKIDKIIDYEKVFPAYHMNKTSWITVRLDNNSYLEIKKLLDNSYCLVSNKSGLTSTDMALKIYDYLKKIPKGKVVTYGQIAEHLGNKGLSRVVGTILRKGERDDIAYYKVLNSSGCLVKTEYKDLQKKLLEDEGIMVVNDKVDLNKYKWRD